MGQSELHIDEQDGAYVAGASGALTSRLKDLLPGYDTRPRRVARQGLRSATALTRPAFLRRRRTVAAFWWDGHPNFGDALTPWLLPHLGVMPVLTDPARARMAGVGSILEMLPEDFSGVVWGSGSLYGNPIRLPRATFAAVRGPLTRDALGLDRDASVALGDPGLLVERVMGRPSVAHRLGVVAHGMHRKRPEIAALTAQRPDQTTQVLTYQPVAHVVRHIASCEAIVSTSLHGLIVADAFGIPAAWAMPEDLFGGRFKFFDYEAVVTPGRSREMTLDATTTVEQVLATVGTAEPDLVERSKDALANASRAIPGQSMAAVLSGGRWPRAGRGRRFGSWPA